MAVTSGFYNSMNGDRKYDSDQMSQLFDGLIADGIFATIYNQFQTSPNEGMTLQVDTGRAWFNHRWVKNDSVLLLTLSSSEILFDRIDAIVIEVDNRDTVRDGFIKVVKGTPSANPVKPTLKNGENSVWQHPIKYVTVRQGVEEITAADIENVVGTIECPFVTGVVSVVSIDNLLTQWDAQWSEWYKDHTTEFEESWRIWYETNTTKFSYDFNEWFSQLQTMLDGDVAANLAKQILDLKSKFNTLLTDHALYDALLDSNNNPILDSNDNEIDGSTIFVTKYECQCR